ncbi:MAG: endo alpha-1,4 polygalactosaminidase [Treponema sp.]|nr:endo alpha-1,4 polygalactosaminidase [Treponema sp.]
MCDIYKDAGLTVLSTDYTGDDSTKIEDSFTKNKNKGYISFAAVERKMNVIPSYSVHYVNDSDVSRLSDAKNFLYLINPDNYSSKQDFISDLCQTDYDALIIDLFCGDEILTASDLQLLKVKHNGGKRLVICYMSIGEAEDYRWYWKKSWKKNPPDYLCKENQDWEGNFKVRYWYPQWQEIICGKDGYLSKILNAGFDGVYLDIIDAFEYFEEDYE